jgi:hypothetical protein
MATKKKPKPKPTTLSAVDAEALERAIALARQESPGRRAQIDAMLRERDWLRVAEFCAYCCQDTELKLKPWEIVPCWVESDPDVLLREWKGPDLGQRRRAARLLKNLYQHGLSKFEPRPLEAIEKAERDDADGSGSGPNSQSGSPAEPAAT